MGAVHEETPMTRSTTRTRRRTALLTAPLALGLAVPAVGLAGAVAGAEAGSHGTAPAVVARAGTGLIQGVVVDDLGRPVDDVRVEAVNARGTVKAADLTYANQAPDGPQHGYFWVAPGAGTYDLVLSKDGYEEVVLEDVEQLAKRRTSLGQVELPRVPLRSHTEAEAVDASLTTRQAAAVEVEVEVRKVRPVGEVVVSDGRVVATARLQASDKGRVVVRLGTLSRGTHSFSVTYLGSDGDPLVEGSKAKRKVTFAVSKPTKGKRSGRK